MAASASVPADTASADSVQTAQLQAIAQYFETFNRDASAQTAQLFAPAGQLKPPFENLIEGPVAIAQYLEKEARGMQALSLCAPRLRPPSQFPKTLQGPTAATNSGANPVCSAGYDVTGRVQNSLFSVGVAWIFQLNESAEILWVEVCLLANFKELLSIKG